MLASPTERRPAAKTALTSAYSRSCACARRNASCTLFKSELVIAEGRAVRCLLWVVLAHLAIQIRANFIRSNFSRIAREQSTNPSSERDDAPSFFFRSSICPHTKPSAHNAGSRNFPLNTTGSPADTVVGLAFRLGTHKNRRHISRNLEPLLCYAAICSFLDLGTFKRLLSMDSPTPTSLSHLFRQHVQLARPNVPPHSCQSGVIFLVVSARSRTRRRLTARRINILAGADLHRWLLDHTSHC